MHCKRIWLVYLLGVVLITSCGDREKGQKAIVTPEIPVVKALSRDVDLEKEFVGQVYGIVDIPVRARVEGFLDKIHFDEGSMVKKGQLLYSIDPQPYQAKVAEAQSLLAQAKIEAVHAQNELDRIKPLAEINAVSQSDLDAAIADKGAADAAVEAARANLESSSIKLGYATIHSPINGLIGKTKAKVGEFVGRDPNPVILNTVSRIDTIRVEFYITESDYLQMAREMLSRKKEGDTTKRKSMPLRLILSDGSLYEEYGYVTFIDRGVEESTGSILIQSVFPNPNRLIRPGQFARVRAIANQVKGGIIIPQRTVVEFQGKFFVMKVSEDGKVHQHPIEISGVYRDYYLVKEGLKSGDMVVIDALQKVSDGMAIQPVETDFKSKFD